MSSERLGAGLGASQGLAPAQSANQRGAGKCQQIQTCSLLGVASVFGVVDTS